MNGDPKRSSNGELVPGADRVIELSVKGVDAPDDCAVDVGVIVEVFTLPHLSLWNPEES